MKVYSKPELNLVSFKSAEDITVYVEGINPSELGDDFEW